MGGFFGGLANSVSEQLDQAHKEGEQKKKELRDAYFKVWSDPDVSDAVRQDAWENLNKHVNPDAKKGLAKIAPIFGKLAGHGKKQGPGQEQQGEQPQQAGAPPQQTPPQQAPQPQGSPGEQAMAGAPTAAPQQAPGGPPQQAQAAAGQAPSAQPQMQRAQHPLTFRSAIGQAYGEDYGKAQREQATKEAEAGEARKLKTFGAEEKIRTDEDIRKKQAEMQEIDPAFAKEHLPGLMPDKDGKYRIDKSLANTLAKAPPGSTAVHVVPPGSTVVDHTGKVLYSAPEKPEKPPVTEFDRFFLPNFAATRHKSVDQLTPEEKTQAYREFKQDPDAKASMQASRDLMDAQRRMTMSQTPTPGQAKDIAEAMIKHRISPEQVSQMVGGFGAQGSSFKRMVMSEAMKMDPEFDFEQASAEYGLVKSPAFQNTVRYMDSVKESIPLVVKRAQELANGNVRFINGLQNMSKNQLNDPKLKKFQTDTLLVADEIAKILQGGGTGAGTSDAKLKQAQEIIKTSDSPEAIVAALDDVKELIGFRRKALTKGTYMEKQSEGPGRDVLKKPGADLPKTADELQKMLTGK